MFGNTCVCEGKFSTIKEVKSENSNWMAGETLDDSLWLAATNPGIDMGKIMSETPRPQASHWQSYVI